MKFVNTVRMITLVTIGAIAGAMCAPQGSPSPTIMSCGDAFQSVEDYTGIDNTGVCCMSMLSDDATGSGCLLMPEMEDGFLACCVSLEALDESTTLL